ncbi:protein FAR1-RELATED SEQUENCE 5-like [Arachis ipaensis]|uniref:protein FAR1-RELATED SEQUENCE 5-like n=1 Tax=Arachis ipaensis TaxID=130454 RepID=UPI0007AFD5F4|nr:protein FAR1-RELATED SEQUENCE 5-like [Arachis ipaensis]
MSIKEDDVKNDSDNDLGDDFDYQPNAEDDADDDDVDSLDSTSKSEEVCGVKRIADLMVEDIWNLEFRTEDEACQFYNAYSCWHGFVMRKDDVVRDNQGRIISRQLVCNKEGWRNMRYLDLDDRSREARSLTRTKCPARLRVKLDYGCRGWKVSCFVESHNHDLTPPQFAHLVPANRRLTVTDRVQVKNLHNFGVKSCHIMGYIAFQKGGYRHAGFTRKDLYNHINRYRRAKVKNGDANAAINYLIGKSNNDPLFFGKYTFTSDERLEHIFWADGQSIIDYHCFGDIVAFDSTYKKNKYNKPLVIFSGCNHHGQTVIFGSGLLSDETTETYKWLLKTFVEAMGGKSPKAVITDGDLAMRDAIRNVLPDATHRLCGWHLQRNACENIKNPNFLRDFKGFIYDNNDQRDFDRRWAAILDKHNLVGSTWMEKTYETREMWSHCFLRDKFFGYIRTTSQCEGINSLIRFYVNRKNTLIDFMHNLDRALKEYRNNELIADFKSQCSEPVMITSLEVYKRSASCYFTRNIFKEIRNEIQRAGALNITVLSTTLDKVEFSVTALGDPAKDRRVEVDRGKNLFSCSCKLFESCGIPCSHILCAMKFENILEFPDSLIYKRWTKNAKNEFISTEMPVNDDIERVLKFRVGALASNCNKLCDIACKDLADFDEVQSELVNLVIRLQSRKQGKSTPNVNVEGINDPFVVKSKGAPSKRSSWRKKRACSNCHKYGHYYKRCPDLMQHSVEGNPRDQSYGNASAKDSGFSPERFANSSRSFSIKSEHHSGPNTKPFKKGGTRKFTATGMRNWKGKDNTFVEVKESQQDKRHSFTNYECNNDVIDNKCDTRHVQMDVRDQLPSSLPCGNKQGSYMALFVSMHRTL